MLDQLNTDVLTNPYRLMLPHMLTKSKTLMSGLRLQQCHKMLRTQQGLWCARCCFSLGLHEGRICSLRDASGTKGNSGFACHFFFFSSVFFLSARAQEEGH